MGSFTPTSDVSITVAVCLFTEVVSAFGMRFSIRRSPLPTLARSSSLRSLPTGSRIARENSDDDHDTEHLHHDDRAKVTRRQSSQSHMVQRKTSHGSLSTPVARGVRRRNRDNGAPPSAKVATKLTLDRIVNAKNDSNTTTDSTILDETERTSQSYSQLSHTKSDECLAETHSGVLTKSSLSTHQTRNRRLYHRVGFGTVEIREYHRTVGDNPSVSSGPPLSIDWTYNIDDVQTYMLHDYELMQASARRSVAELVVPRLVREDLLLLEWGVSRRAMASAVATAIVCRNQRRQTAHTNSSAGWSRFDAVLQRAATKLLRRDAAWNQSTQDALMLEHQHLRANTGTSTIASTTSLMVPPLLVPSETSVAKATNTEGAGIGSKTEVEKSMEVSTRSKTCSSSLHPSKLKLRGILKHHDRHHVGHSGSGTASCDGGSSLTGRSVASEPVKARRWPEDNISHSAANHRRFFSRTGSKYLQLNQHRKTTNQDISISNDHQYSYSVEPTEESSSSVSLHSNLIVTKTPHSPPYLPARQIGSPLRQRQRHRQHCHRSRRRVHHHVGFGSVEIRKYNRTVGDHPACSSGPPICLDWSYDRTHVDVFSVDEYEQLRSSVRRAEADLLLPRFAREELLLFEWNVSVSELATAVSNVDRTQKQRKRTIALSGGGGGGFFPKGHDFVHELVERTTTSVATLWRREESAKRNTDQALVLERHNLTVAPPCDTTNKNNSTATVQLLDEQSEGGSFVDINPKDEKFDYAAYYLHLHKLNHGNNSTPVDEIVMRTASPPPQLKDDDTVDSGIGSVALYTSTPRRVLHRKNNDECVTPRPSSQTQHSSGCRTKCQGEVSSRRQSQLSGGVRLNSNNSTSNRNSNNASQSTTHTNSIAKASHTAQLSRAKSQQQIVSSHRHHRDHRNVYPVHESYPAKATRKLKKKESTTDSSSTIKLVNQDIVVLPAGATAGTRQAKEVHFLPDEYLISPLNDFNMATPSSCFPVDGPPTNLAEPLVLVGPTKERMNVRKLPVSE